MDGARSRTAGVRALPAARVILGDPAKHWPRPALQNPVSLLPRGARHMIKRFHVLYVGQIELDNVGLDGTPADDRRYSNERLSEVFLTDARRRAADGRSRLLRAVDGRAPLPARGLRMPAQPGAARPLARHPDQAPEVRLRLQRPADVASDPAGRRLRDGRHRHRRPRDHGRRPRLPHARGGNLRRAAARCRGQPRILRGAASAPAAMLQRRDLPLQGQVLRVSAAGRLPRLPAEGHHHGAAAEAPAGRGLDADRQRQDHRHDGPLRPQGHGRR